MSEPDEYARKLLELGFKRFNAEETEKKVRMQAVHIPSGDSPVPKAGKEELYPAVAMADVEKPYFFTVDAEEVLGRSFTIALDGQGNTYMHFEEAVDLTPHGFVNLLLRPTMN